MSGVNDQREVQIKAAVRRFIWRFMKAFFRGNSGLNPGEPDGLDMLVSPSRRLQPIDTVTYQLALEDLVRLMEAVQAEAPHVAAVSRLGWKSVLYAHYAAGVAPDIAFMEFQDTNGYLATHPVLMFQGVPLLVSDQISDDLRLGVEKDATRMYVYSALKCGAVTATHEGEPQIVVRTQEDELFPVEWSRLTWSIAPLLLSEDAAAYLTFRVNSHVL